MRKLILTRGAGAGGLNSAVLRLVAGGAPELSAEALPVQATSGYAFPMYQMTPDGSRIVATTGASGGLVISDVPPTEDALLPAGWYAQPPTPFSSSTYTMAVSNSFVAVGGQSAPYFMVYNLATKGVETVPTAGLGFVRALKFSPSGDRLAVLHATSPYLRIYDTSNWTFVVPATPPGRASGMQSAALAFSPDGAVVVTGTNSDPYICAFSMTGARLAAISSTSLVSDVADMVLHPDGDGVVWVGSNYSAGVARIGYFSFSSMTATRPYGDLGAAAYCAAVDSVARCVYITHSQIESRFVSRLDFDGPHANTLRAPGGVLEVLAQGVAGLSLVELNPGKITGTVRDVYNTPAQRQVVARHRAHGYLSAVTTSDAAGNYQMTVQNTEPHDVQFMAAPGEQLNDLFFARVQPEPV